MMQTFTPLTRQHGLALVETAITLPFLLFVMLAASEFTNAFVQHTTLTKATRDAARHVAEEAIHGGTGLIDLNSGLTGDAKRLLVYGNTAGAGAPVVTGLGVGDVTVSDVGGNNVEVTVNFPYTGILGSVLPTFGYGSSISLLFNMNATVVMRAL